MSNGSTDRSEELARGVSEDRVRVIAYPARRGKAAALNLGVAKDEG